jgi:nucleotide-binding universal stress UspA family protein
VRADREIAVSVESSSNSREPEPPVLLAYDGSEGAALAIAAAGAMFRGRTAIVVHAWHPRSSVLPEPLCEPADAVDAPGAAAARRIAEEGARRAGDAGFDARAHVALARHSEWQSLDRAADELDVGMMVLGSHGTSSLGATQFGGTAKGVLLNSRRPVLIVPSPERQVLEALPAGAAGAHEHPAHHELAPVASRD